MRSRTMRRVLAGSALLVALTGCGADTASRPKSGAAATSAIQPAGDVGEWLGGLPVPDEKAAAEARAAIARVVAAVSALPAYQLDMRWMQKKGGTVARGLYQITGKAPRTIRIDIREGKGKGTKVLYSGGATARVRPDGLLGAITVDLPVNDERLLSVRGYNIPQTDLKGLMDQLGDPRHQARLLGKSAEHQTIEVAGGPLLRGCTRMVVEVDARSALPLTIDQYDAREVVFHLEIRNFRARKHVDLEI